MQGLGVGAHLKCSLGSIKICGTSKKGEEARSKRGTVPGKPFSFPRKVVNCPQANLCALLWPWRSNETRQTVLCFNRELLLRLVRKENINKKSS